MRVPNCRFVKIQGPWIGGDLGPFKGISAALLMILLLCSSSDPLYANRKSRQLAVAPASVDFGSVTVGTSSTQIITVTNTGEWGTNISAATVAGSGFSLNGPALPLSLLPGQTASFSVTFLPSALGTAMGSLSLSSNAQNSSTTISLSGTGAQPLISVAPSNVSFGSVPVGVTTTQTVTVSNPGNANLNVMQAAGPAAGFSVSGLTMPLTVPPGQAAKFSISFTPTVAGNLTSTVAFVSNAPASPTLVSVVGAGVQPSSPQISLTPGSLVFGSVTLGSSGTQSLTVTNTGSASLSITAANVTGSGFSTSGLSLPMTVAAGGSGTITVSFAPSTSGSVTGSLSLASNAPTSPAAIVLNGTGVAATLQLAASPTSLSFSNTAVGSTSSQNVTLTNTGNSNVTISQVTISGAGFSASGVTSTEMLAPGQSVAVTVSFAPTAVGSMTGSLTIASTATNSPANTSLSGSGVQVSSGGTPDATIPSTFFGMHLGYGPTGYSTPILAPIQVGAMGKPPGTNWEFIETARGTYNWTNLDKAVVYANSHNIPIFESHEWVPEWATSDTSTCFLSTGVYHCPAPPSDENTVTTCQAPLAGVNTTDCMWKEFLTSIVNRYKSTGIQTGCTSSNPQCHGVIQMYEGWNEPPYPSPMPIADFVTFETDFYNTVKANDSNAEVCSPAFQSWAPGTEGDLWNKSFFSGGPPIFDCYDFHINDASPEHQLEDIVSLQAEGFPTGVKMYATEAGRWGGCSASVSPPLTPQAYIARIELLYWSWGVKRHYWFGYSTCVPLTNQPTTPTLTSAGIAYGTMESWMVGATMSTPCAASGTVWTCGLSGPNGYQALAVWDTAGTSMFAVPSQYTQYQDLEGNTQSISGLLAIGPEPILLANGITP